jgi:hypothetical protein
MTDVSKERRGDFAVNLLNWAGAYTILFIGCAHVLVVGEHFLVATYLGVLFLGNCASAIAVAAGLYLDRYTFWAWLLGGVIAGGALVGFLASRTIGLPGVTEFVGQWFNIAGLLTLGLEGLFLSLSLLAITPQGRALVRTIDQRGFGQAQAAEGAAPEQEGPEQKAPRQIEKEMNQIRGRMTPDLVDLRKQVEPQAVKEQVEQSLRGRLHGILGLLKPASERRQPGLLAPLIILFIVVIFVLRRMSGRNSC